MSASRLHSTRAARIVTAKVDSCHRKSGRKTLRNISLSAREGEGMKCRRVDSTRLELHDPSRQKSTRLTGSQVARHLEIFRYVLKRVRV